MAKSTIYAIGPERITVERIGREYAVLRADGSVHEHVTHMTEQAATLVAVRLSNQLRRGEKP